MRSTRCSRRWTRTVSTRSGASATSSATGRSRMSASRCCRSETAICLAGNHDLVVLGKISLATFGGEAGEAAAWTREVLDDAGPCVSDHACAERRDDRRGALPRQPARPGVGLRAFRRRRTVDVRRHHRSARPRRPQSHRARARRRRHRGSRRPGGRGHDARPRRRAAAPQPRLGRPAPRRRSTRRLARG